MGLYNTFTHSYYVVKTNHKGTFVKINKVCNFRNFYFDHFFIKKLAWFSIHVLCWVDYF